jgi:hypothetical protein
MGLPLEKADVRQQVELSIAANSSFEPYLPMPQIAQMTALQA